MINTTNIIRGKGVFTNGTVCLQDYVLQMTQSFNEQQTTNAL